MWRALIAVLLGVSACATLGPVTEGQAPGLSWYVADMELARTTTDPRAYWQYTFFLVVRETRGTALTFNEIKTTVYQPGTTPWSPLYRGVWELPANGQFRIPLKSGLACPHTVPACQGPNVPIPLWQIVMMGRSIAGEPVRYVLDIRLPPEPPAGAPGTTASIPSISLTPPRPAAAPSQDTPTAVRK